MISRSKTQTQKLAARLAKKILRATHYALRAKIIALHGDLGAGKTTFVQGFMKALGIKQYITSPTFVIFRKYHLSEKSKVESKKELKISKSSKLKTQSYQNIYHLDLYRIHKPKELLDLGFKKIINDPQNIALIEWPERIKKILPKNMIWIVLEHGKRENERLIEIT